MRHSANWACPKPEVLAKGRDPLNLSIPQTWWGRGCPLNLAFPKHEGIPPNLERSLPNLEGSLKPQGCPSNLGVPQSWEEVCLPNLGVP